MLNACKTGINYSKHDSSMREFTAIDESRRWHTTMKLVAALQSGLMKEIGWIRLEPDWTSQASQSNVLCSAGCYFRRSRHRYSFMKISCTNKSILKPDPISHGCMLQLGQLESRQFSNEVYQSLDVHDRPKLNVFDLPRRDLSRHAET